MAIVGSDGEGTVARMLGRVEAPGCCPGCRAGWYRRRHGYGPDCSGGATDTRWRKRVEKRQVRAEIRALLAEMAY